MTALHDAPAVTPVEPDPPRMRGGRRRGRDAVRSVSKHVGLIILSIVMIYPLIWLVVSSLKPNDKIFTDIGLFGNDLSFDNYVYGWTSQQLPFSVFLSL